MIFNEHLDRLMEVDIVKKFTLTNHMQSKRCRAGANPTFILYRLPYVVGFWDSVIENFLEIVFVDLDANLLIDYGSPVSIAIDLGLQNLEALKILNFDNHNQLDIFSSEKALKMYCLHTGLEAIDKLLPLIDSKGGLTSLKDGTFHPQFDFSDTVKPIYQGLKERYINCIGDECKDS
jgi:hypothetical protein